VNCGVTVLSARHLGVVVKSIDKIMFKAPTLTASVTVEVKASPEILYETMMDINAASFVPTIVSQEIVNDRNKKEGSDESLVGTVLREEKIFVPGAKPVVNYKTITAVRNNPRSVSAVVHKDLKSGAANEPARTGSWTIHPLDEESCCIVWTFASFAAGISGYLSYIFCRHRILKRTTSYFRNELEQYGAEAERRQRAQLSESE